MYDKPFYELELCPTRKNSHLSMLKSVPLLIPILPFFLSKWQYIPVKIISFCIRNINCKLINIPQRTASLAKDEQTICKS